jgi:hypothetical protein
MGLIPAGDLAAMRDVLGDLSNAALTKITGPGLPDRNGDPAGGTDLWTGEAPGFLARVRRESVYSRGSTIAPVISEVPVRVDVFTITDGVAPLLEVAGPDWESSVVTIVDRRTATPVTLVLRVTAMEHTANGLLDSVRLELDEVQAP